LGGGDNGPKQSLVNHRNRKEGFKNWYLPGVERKSNIKGLIERKFTSSQFGKRKGCPKLREVGDDRKRERVGGGNRK